MAKKSSVNRNKKRIALSLKFANKRKNLKKIRRKIASLKTDIVNNVGEANV